MKKRICTILEKLSSNIKKNKLIWFLSTLLVVVLLLPGALFFPWLHNLLANYLQKLGGARDQYLTFFGIVVASLTSVTTALMIQNRDRRREVIDRQNESLQKIDNFLLEIESSPRGRTTSIRIDDWSSHLSNIAIALNDVGEGGRYVTFWNIFEAIEKYNDQEESKRVFPNLDILTYTYCATAIKKVRENKRFFEI